VDDGAHFEIPFEHEAGVYANAFSSWHTEHEFTIDFAAKLRPPADILGPEGNPSAIVVARVRIPAALAFELIRQINGEMAHYEEEWGEIHRPRRREEEP
jgi:hypothetical protein